MTTSAARLLPPAAALTAGLLAGLLGPGRPAAAQDPASAPPAASVEAPRAPSLDDARQVWRGPTPVGQGERLLVVEVWATWCAACRASFPLLSRLQREHLETVRVLAITDDPDLAVAQRIQADPAAMRFDVAIVSEQTVQAWLVGGFGGRGIPSTYLVEGGRVLWGGPPEELEAALRERLGETPAGG